jgi:Protein of unknown function (DUF1585)
MLASLVSFVGGPRTPSRWFAFPVIALLSACSAQPEPPVEPPPSTPVLLSAADHLSRASLALRGFRPSVEDLQAVTADPQQLPVLVDGYLRSPDFAETIRDLHNRDLLLDLEAGKYVYPNIGPLAAATFSDIRTLMQEPLRLIEHVVTSGRPYTEIITANYTMANGTVAAAFGLPHVGDPAAWEETKWNDGRPAAGILSSTILYQRYVSAGDNFNRGRANMLSRVLLCHDYLDSDIVLDTNVNLADPDVVAEAVVRNPSCAGCHHTLDPLASYLFPFPARVYPNAVTQLPYNNGYRSRFADLWQTTNKRPPMFFGNTATGLDGLAKTIAADPRFARCAAQRFASYFTQVPMAQLDPKLIASLQEGFVASGFDARALARSIILSDAFRVSHAAEGGDAEATVGLLRMSPRQLSRTLYELTGARWMTNQATKISNVPLGPVDLLDNDTLGYRVLGGGIDSYFVTAPQTTMGATSALVSRRAAVALAGAVVEYDRTAPTSARRLFLKADVTSSDEAAVRAELVYLLARVNGELVEAADPRVDDAYHLFQDLLAQHGDPARAWKFTLGGLFADSRAVYY